MEFMIHISGKKEIRKKNIAQSFVVHSIRIEDETKTERAMFNVIHPIQNINKNVV